MSTAGPSRPPTQATAPSTSGDSESVAPPRVGPDVAVLRELGKQALVEALNEVQGAKTLVLDSALAGPLGLVTDVASLKHHGVDKMFWLEPGPLNVSTRNVVWLCRPKRAHMRTIAEQVRAAPGLVYTVLLVPRVTELCRRVLEDEGVIGDVTLAEFKLELIPIENDVLSLELDDVARDIFLRGDDTPIYYSALALGTLQRALGSIPRVVAKGDAAQKLAALLKRHKPDVPPSEHIDSLIIIDRAVDWVTPMCAQLTYEGMLDEFIGIHHAHMEVDPKLLDPNASAGKKRKHHLSSADRLFADLRDLNFAVVGSRLSKLARRLETDYGGAKNLKSVTQMRDFVGKLGGLKSEQESLRLHTGLAEQLMPLTQTEEFNKTLEVQQNLVAGYDPAAQLAIIEDLLAQEASMPAVLRSAVLMSLTAGGIRPKQLETFKRDFLQTYGYHHLPLLVSLQELGLLVRAPSPVQPPLPIRKSLRLVVDDVDDANPQDISYVYSGYAPTSIRLVQAAAQRSGLSGDKADVVRMEGRRPITGFRGLEDAVAALPGASSDSGTVGAGRHAAGTTLVFFLGGCTYAEISALRFMNRQGGRQFMVATTGMVNGTTLLKSFGDAEPAPLQQQR
ncbi:hypothetical protein CspeluHIS016_0102520 [Cutaneotrichosporon spelunceum]|uniref:ATP binding protein n=1 Tax=Cutaneotrichosporon spelunceum TaxID=1672016 RepID=A0AAD3TMG1_9TREE|nr:hypothetical protein CspeluHIS016_0102520 [Cutaneotrichosporon spelunceum]